MFFKILVKSLNSKKNKNSKKKKDSLNFKVRWNYYSRTAETVSNLFYIIIKSDV